MTYFLSSEALSAGSEALLDAEESQHLLKARRIRAGERFAVQDPQRRRFWAVLAEGAPAKHGQARVRVLEPAPVPPLPAVTVRLWIAAVKDKALELILQKANELGVDEVQVFIADHSPMGWAELGSERLKARWNRIVWEACKQCDRPFPAHLGVWAKLSDLLGDRPQRGVAWVLDRDGLPPAPVPAAQAQGVTLLVGPEGGLTESEVQSALSAGFARISLGPLTLRTETAAIAGCAVALQNCTRPEGSPAISEA
jgi:16S rRNA (uracil1498-N3)-methyltransferase